MTTKRNRQPKGTSTVTIRLPGGVEVTATAETRHEALLALLRAAEEADRG